MMLTERVATATDRLAALGERLQQLDQRLKRLEAGECSSVEDLNSARANARQQRARAVEAQAVLDRVRGHLSGSFAWRSPSTGGTGHQGPSLTADTTSDGPEPRSSGRYWRAVMDEARHRGWRDWSGALCQVASAALPSVRGVAISVVVDRVPRSLATTDEWTFNLEEAERVLGEGPASSAHAAGRPIAARFDDPADETWIAWSSWGLSRGVRGVWAYPYYLPGLDHLTVTFYRRHLAATPAEQAEACVLAGLVGRALMADLRRDDGVRPTDPVDVATGVLAERLQLSPADAFARIRAHAFAGDHGLREVATSVIEGRFGWDGSLGLA